MFLLTDIRKLLLWHLHSQHRARQTEDQIRSDEDGIRTENSKFESKSCCANSYHLRGHQCQNIKILRARQSCPFTTHVDVSYSTHVTHRFLTHPRICKQQALKKEREISGTKVLHVGELVGK